jgi:hypothetical protein
VVPDGVACSWGGFTGRGRELVIWLCPRVWRLESGITMTVRANAASSPGPPNELGLGKLYGLQLGNIGKYCLGVEVYKMWIAKQCGYKFWSKDGFILTCKLSCGFHEVYIVANVLDV